MSSSKTVILLFLTFAALRAEASVRFVSPLAGAQLLGRTVVEITTTEQKVDRVEFRVDGVLAAIVRTPPFRTVHDFGTDLTPREISARVFSSGYSKQEEISIRSAAATAEDSIDVDLVELPLQIRSARQLNLNDLRIRENGVRQELLELRRLRPPSVFTFVIDRSLSMREGKLDAALAAVASQLSQLRKGDEARLILFNHVVSKPRAISTAADLRVDLTPAGGTSLRDAVLAVGRNKRSIIVIITDGTDRNSVASKEAAIGQLAHSGMTAYAITLDRGNARGFLNDLATRTGGSVVSSSAATLDRDLGRLFSDINSRYTAVYQSHGVGKGWRAIAVTPARGARILAMRKGYFAR